MPASVAMIQRVGRRAEQYQKSALMFKTKFSESKSRCPQCRSDSIYKSHRRGFLERIVLRLTNMRPYRCRECYERFYAKERGEMVSKAAGGRGMEEVAGGHAGGINALTTQPRG
jgi:uncharacterized protein with PIN domain